MACLEEARRFSHRPLKKRPLSILVENVTSDDELQPQDLRVKRRKEGDANSSVCASEPRLSTSEIPPEPSLSTLPVMHSQSSLLSHQLPTSVSTLSASHTTHQSFPQSTPTSPFPENAAPHLPKYSIPPSLDRVTKPLETNFTPLADFYLQLFHRNSVCHKEQGQGMTALPWPILPSLNSVHSASTRGWLPPNPVGACSVIPSPPGPFSPPTESRLSSPRSTSSEDSGLGTEFVSEDEELMSKEGLQPMAVPLRHCCESCGKSYSTQSGLRKHSELHCASLGSRAFACKHCAKAYTSVGALKMHIRTHTLPCKCQVCGKAFSRPWLLQGHIRTHTGEKPFECHQCQRSFADRSNLRAHLQTHERVKKYACQTCNKTFSRMSLLNKHSENACPGLLAVKKF